MEGYTYRGSDAGPTRIVEMHRDAQSTMCERGMWRHERSESTMSADWSKYG